MKKILLILFMCQVCLVTYAKIYTSASLSLERYNNAMFKYVGINMGFRTKHNVYLIRNEIGVNYYNILSLQYRHIISKRMYVLGSFNPCKKVIATTGIQRYYESSGYMSFDTGVGMSWKHMNINTSTCLINTPQNIKMSIIINIEIKWQQKN